VSSCSWSSSVRSTGAFPGRVAGEGPPGANLALRFVLELSALAATGCWGYTTGGGVMRWVLAIGAPAVVIVVWALFVSPKATVDVRRPVRLAIEFLVSEQPPRRWPRRATRRSR
jgi:Protein of unknown function (DUF2568)